MAQQQITHEERYLAAYHRFERNGAAADPAWLRELRQAAIARFQELGFPVQRRGNEEWKYTDIGPIARTPFDIPPPTPHVKAEGLRPFTFGERRWNTLVFVDGRLSESLSRLPSLPRGARAMSLSHAVADPDMGEVARRHLAHHASYRDRAFTALNTAFLGDGAFVYVPDGVAVEEPIHLVFLSSGREDTASHPRLLVVTGRDSKAVIVQTFGGLAEVRYFANAVTEVALGQGSSVQHYRIQRHSEQAYHVGTTQVTLGPDSSYRSVTADFGGRLVRNNLNVVMAGEHSSTVLNGLYLVGGSQHVDNEVVIDHAASHTTARELYKGVLDGRSRAVFHGSIVVRERVHKADAEQVDKNLLLSDQAEVDAKPAFWIYADDVRASHGAACGQMDEGALFYLRSRGIAEQDARKILTRAFVTEIVDSIVHEGVRRHMDELVLGKLQALPGLSPAGRQTVTESA